MQSRDFEDLVLNKMKQYPPHLLLFHLITILLHLQKVHFKFSSLDLLIFTQSYLAGF